MRLTVFQPLGYTALFGERPRKPLRGAVPKRLLKIAALGLAILPLLGFPGCRVKTRQQLPPEKVLPLQTATLEELLGRLRRQAEAVHSINAVAELEPSTGSAYSGVIEEYHDVRAFVLAQQQAAGAAGNGPGRQIRMIGQAPVVRKNVFDMVADDETFQIFLPTKNKFIVGPTRLERRSQKPIENLRPQHLFEALFLDAPFSDTPHLLEENEFGGQRYYAVSEITLGDHDELELHRKWWFDRTDLSLVRVQRFDLGGVLVADIHYGQWREENGVSFPHEIELVRPQDDYRLKLLIKQVRLNEPLAAEKFKLERPPGVEAVELKAETDKPPQEPR